MNTLSKISLTLSSIGLLAALADARMPADGGACWSQTGQFYDPMTSNPPGYVCYTLGSMASSSRARARATGLSSNGSGRAWDNDIGCEAKVRTAAATGIYSEAWRNDCDPGEIEFFGSATITGLADLIDDDCAGAAYGYQQITSNVLSAPIAAVLNESAGETNSGELGSVTGALRGLELNLPITHGLGEGRYEDNDADSDFAYKCDDFFTIEFKSRSYMKVWANSPLWDLYAEVKVWMSGSSYAEVYLGTCPM
ncbi:MAG: hypothetical protein CMJ89_04265 [Planctomycetes bacterium]|jgi:hypothetical protein|nr:hypothetical protein [Planctomycetota bacterium]